MVKYLGEVSQETYELAQKIVLQYERKLKPDKNEPYLKVVEITITSHFNHEYDEDKECKCGHPYYRHFDSYERMEACGCKYCGCYEFELNEEIKIL